jgi:hypothetical protein
MRYILSPFNNTENLFSCVSFSYVLLLPRANILVKCTALQIERSLGRIGGFLMLCSVYRWLCSDKLTRWMFGVSLEIRFSNKCDCHLFVAAREREGRNE